MATTRVHLSLGDTVYIGEEKDHGIIEQFVPFGKLIVRLRKKDILIKLSRGDVKKLRQSDQVSRQLQSHGEETVSKDTVINDRTY